MLDSSFLKNSPINFSFLTWNYEDKHFHEDIELIYVFDGQLDIVIENSKYILYKDDFLIINSNKSHSFKAIKNSLVGSFLISYVEVSKLIGQNYLLFWCNSTIEKSNEYNNLSYIICNFANSFIRSNEKDLISIISKFYELLYQITNSFLITTSDKGQKEIIDNEKDRVNQITRYIDANYKNRISLSELSKMLFLTDAYLSKYFKKQFGMNFSNYLNSVRLNHAIEELLYTNAPIIRIALDNGFSSISTFNKVFKEVYGMTPSKYRKSNSKIIDNEKKDEDLTLVIEKAKELFNVENENINNNNNKEIYIKILNEIPLKKVWCELINVGAAEEILRSDMQNHILEMKNKLKFKYVRIWDLYSSDMLLDININNSDYNFHKLDKVLDFLVENDIIPYLELNIKSRILIRSIDNILIKDEENIVFENFEKFQKFFTNLIIHLINRYGNENISNWYFEFWKNEKLIIEKLYNVTALDIDNEYLKYFSAIYNIFKKYLPEVKIGGAGLSIRFGEDAVFTLLDKWSKTKEKPDFLTFYSFPYIQDIERSDGINKISTNRNYLNDYLNSINKLVEKSEINVNEFHLSEWNNTISNRNIFNDSCQKGAYIVKSIIDNFDKVDAMGYWFASDITADFYDSTFLINGGSGLISKDGIYKPAYYAYDFLNRLGKKFIDRNENYLASYNGYNEYGIICHNYKFYGYQFYTTSEDIIEFSNLSKYYENNDVLEMDFTIDGVLDGNYDVKVYSINTEHGSLQDEWLRMSCPDNLTHSEIEYLKRICVPHLNILNSNVENKKLNFKTKLLANEIQYINIRYRIK